MRLVRFNVNLIMRKFWKTWIDGKISMSFFLSIDFPLFSFQYATSCVLLERSLSKCRHLFSFFLARTPCCHVLNFQEREREKVGKIMKKRVGFLCYELFFIYIITFYLSSHWVENKIKLLRVQLLLFLQQ